MEVKGLPPRSLIVMATRRKVFFDDDYKHLSPPNSKGKVHHVNGKKLSDMMSADKGQIDFVDFIDRCTEWKPDKRMTPLEAIEHPWIQTGLKEVRGDV